MMYRTLMLAAAALALCASTQMPQQEKYRLSFVPMVGSQPFSCNTTYSALGVDRADVTPKYLRFYISRVELIDANGKAVPLDLDQDGTWQQRNVAFISFEGNNKACGGGSPLDNRVIAGSAPAGKYVALRFVVGIPPNLNHQDATVAAPPFDLSAMFWSWQFGYKFMRFDTVVHKHNGGNGYYIFETGSAQCTGDGANTRCAQTNEAPITLAMSDFTRPIAIDVAAMVAGVDLERDGDCMFEHGQKCGPEGRSLGMDGSHQSVFRVR